MDEFRFSDTPRMNSLSSLFEDLALPTLVRTPPDRTDTLSSRCARHQASKAIPHGFNIVRSMRASHARRIRAQRQRRKGCGSHPKELELLRQQAAGQPEPTRKRLQEEMTGLQKHKIAFPF